MKKDREVPLRRGLVAVACASWLASTGAAQHAAVASEAPRPAAVRGLCELPALREWNAALTEDCASHSTAATPSFDKAVRDVARALKAPGGVDASRCRSFENALRSCALSEDDGVSAILRLGVDGGVEGVGLLASILDDGAAGRATVGVAPVPAIKRCAAAFALGLSKHPSARAALREFWSLPGARDTESTAAAALALGFADDADDAAAFAAYLREGRGAPAAREAIAAALMAGRHALTVATREEFSLWLVHEPGGAGRGVASASARFADGPSNDALVAATRSEDAVTRAFAVVALAARGDSRYAEGVLALSAGEATEREFGVYAERLAADRKLDDAPATARAPSSAGAYAAFHAGLSGAPNAARVAHLLSAAARVDDRKKTTVAGNRRVGLGL